MEKPPGYEEATRSTSTEAVGAFDGDRKTVSLEYALISIVPSDRIHLLRFPEHVTERILAVFRSTWPKNIQRVKLVADHPEIKLRGNPFLYGQDDEKIAIRVCFLELFNVLAREGWGVHPVLASIGRMGFDSSAERNSIVFQPQAPRHLSWICVSFNPSSYIHLINSPAELAQSFSQVFGHRVEKCNQDLVSSHCEIKLREDPWSGWSRNEASSRLFILDLLRCLEEHRYALYASMRLDNSFESSATTWFCCRS